MARTFRGLYGPKLQKGIYTIGLVVRASDGLMRRARNVALSCLLEAVRARKRTVDLDNVNRVLMQPHWREERDIDSALF